MGGWWDEVFLTLFRMDIFLDIFTAAKSPPPKICHTYPTMMKLGTVIPWLKKIQKICESLTQTLRYADISHQHVFTGNQEIQKQIPFWYIISNSLKVF